MGWSGPMTHRQFLVWQTWLEEQWNEPNRTDYYLMQIHQEQVKEKAKNPRAVKLEGSRLVFSFRKSDGKKQVPKPLTKEGREELAKQQWISRMSAPITVKNGGEPDKIILPPQLLKRKMIEEQQKKIRAEADKRKESKRQQKPVTRRKRKPNG